MLLYFLKIAFCGTKEESQKMPMRVANNMLPRSHTCDVIRLTTITRLRFVFVRSNRKTTSIKTN